MFQKVFPMILKILLNKAVLLRNWLDSHILIDFCAKMNLIWWNISARILTIIKIFRSQASRIKLCGNTACNKEYFKNFFIKNWKIILNTPVLPRNCHDLNMIQRNLITSPRSLWPKNVYNCWLPYKNMPSNQIHFCTKITQNMRIKSVS